MTYCHNSNRLRGTAGFSLIEMSILLAVIGLLTVTLLTSGLIGREKYRLTETEEKMEKILSAIQVYYNREGHLPCPAARNAAVNATNFGLSTSCDAANNPADQTYEWTTAATGTAGTDRVRFGSVPTRTLLLADSDMFDEWGARFTYGVITNLATSAQDFRDFRTQVTNGVIEIRDENGIANATSTSEINGFVLISHGADRKGGVTRNGTVGWPCGANDLDDINCYTNGTYKYLVDMGVDENKDPADANANFTGPTRPYYYDLVRSMKTSEIVEAAASGGGSSSTSSTSGADPSSPPASPTGSGEGSGSGSGSSSGGPGGSPDPAVAAKSCYLYRPISAQSNFMCAVGDDNRLSCWGGQNVGQLGDGQTNVNSTTPVEVSGGYTDWAVVDTSQQSACGLRTSGEAYCWGSNANGKLGNGTTANASVPTLVSGGYTDWVYIDSGLSHSCGVRGSGKIMCWGSNAEGELGDGTTTESHVPVEATGGFSNWNFVSAADKDTCGIRSGRIYCWGDNQFGQLGDGTNTDSAAPTAISGGFNDWARVWVNRRFACGIRSGRGYCWGVNSNGQLGIGSTTPTNVPTEISGAHTNWSIITGENNTACGIRGGAAYCWGLRDYGRIGDGGATTGNQTTPALVTGGYTDFVHIATSPEHTCGARETGAIYCWGRNEAGEFGLGNTTDSTTPIASATGITQVQCGFGANCSTTFVEAVGGGSMSYALMPDGNAYAWGWNGKGVFGNGTTTDSLTPTQMGTYTDWYAIATDHGGGFACGIRKNGRLYCWGNRTNGGVADGGATAGNQLTPVEAGLGYNDWVEIDVDFQHACARRGFGQVYCWGENNDGRLGNGTTTDSNVPVQVSGNYEDWSDIDIGGEHSCGIRNDGEAWCWGSNNVGQLGDGNNPTDSLVPVLVSGGVADWKYVGVETNTTCGLTETGRAYCWGENWAGMVGDGTTTQANTPVEVSGAHTDWTFIRGGHINSCGVRAGVLYCWGRRANGMVADGGVTTGNQLTPVAVSGGITDWVFANISSQNACGSTASGKVYCWGLNDVSQVGDGTTTQREVPTEVTGLTNTCNAPTCTGTGDAYVVDQANNRIQKFDKNGNFLLKFGTSGTGNGQFNTPVNVTLDSSGNVYVSDTGNNRIQKFDSNGNFLMKFGTSGAGNGQLNGPEGIAVDSSGNIWVVDRFNHRVQKFSSSGSYLLKFGSNGAGNGQFVQPEAIAIDSSGNLWITDSNNNRVQKFDSSGNYLLKFGTNGSGNGQFSDPDDIAIDSSGNIWVADSGNDRIQKFDSSGTFLLKSGSNGTTNGKFSGPTGITVDADDNVWVSDYDNSRVQKFDSSGVFISKFGSNGTGDGQMNDPEGLAVITNACTSSCKIDIRSGNKTSMALNYDGTVKAWGENTNGVFGDNSTTSSAVPTLAATTYDDWQVIDVIDKDDKGCGIRENGELYCWGPRGDRIGDGGATTGTQLTPALVTGGFTDWEAVSVGGQNACALRGNGRLYCWGANWAGQVGDNSTTTRNTPVEVFGASIDWIFIGPLNDTVCGIRGTGDSGTLYCWGENGYGEAGIGAMGADQLTPALVSGGFTDWVNAGTESSTVCGARASGRAYCWGYNPYGQIGDNSTTNRNTPTEINGAYTNWSMVLTAGDNSCGIRDGHLYCWGRKDLGVIGDGLGGAGNQLTPVEAAGGFTDWQTVSAGDDNFCAARESGEYYCWGANDVSQVGDGTTTQRNEPTEVEGVNGCEASTGCSVVPVRDDMLAADKITCMVTRQGKAYCWGNNANGQIGDGTTADKTAPTEVSGAHSDWLQISSDDAISCGIRGSGGEGTAYCWGDRTSGAIGDGGVTTGNQTTPALVSGNYADWRQINVESSSRHVCGTRVNGRGYCWGSNSYGELGDGTTVDKNVPTEISGAQVDWMYVQAGGFNSCGIRSTNGASGTAYCWGRNHTGGVGNGGFVQQNTPVLVNGGFTNWTRISSNGDHTCGLLATGRAYCWGDNDEGQLGDNTIVDKAVPTQVNGAYTDWEYIDGGSYHTCGIRAGAIYCWGDNWAGAVGDNSTTDRIVPTAISGVANANWSMVAVGNDSTCASKASGKVYCWGRNDEGQIGDGSTTTRLEPVEVANVSAPDPDNTCSGDLCSPKPFINTDNTSCALSKSGKAYCWGANWNGQIGDNTTTGRIAPTLVNGGYSDWVQISTTSSNACGVRVDGSGYCWGSNSNGQIGDNTTTDRHVPTLVTGGHTWKTIEIQDGQSLPFTCGVTTGGAGYCWGYNGDGELGDNSTTQRNAPVQINGNYTDWMVIDTGMQSTCGIRSTGGTQGEVYCWGSNGVGQLGNGNTGTDSLVPVLVSGGYGDWTRISAGADYAACGIRATGQAYCWGENSGGRLGDGTTTSSNVPVEVSGGSTNWSTISSGDHTCGIRGGNLYCWGDNANGELGDGTTVAKYVPTLVSGGYTDWESVAVGWRTTCAARADHSYWCWGLNSDGALGDGTTTSSTVPVRVANLESPNNPCATTGDCLPKYALTADDTSCAIADNNKLYCWGLNNAGQYGNNSTTATLVPSEGGGGFTDWKWFDNNSIISCGVRSDDSGWCWGANNVGQVGDNTTTQRRVPTSISGGYSWRMIDAEDGNNGAVCGATTDGKLYCWGDNNEGRLGDGTTTERHVPTLVKGGYEDWWWVRIQGINSACGLRGEDGYGYAHCWGDNTYGQLGDSTNTDSLTPVAVSGGYNDWTTLNTNGGNAVCGLRSNGRAYCWGQNNNGQLGDGSGTNKNVPTEIAGAFTDWTDVYADNHSCGLRNGGRMYCWGLGTNGELGNGASSSSSTLVQVSGSYTDWIAMNVGYRQTCGLRSDNKFYCWGAGTAGQLGDGQNSNSNVPVQVANISAPTPENCTGTACNSQIIGAGNNYNCSITTAGSLYCWGTSAVGEFGNGTWTPTYTTPTLVAGNHSDWIQISTGKEAACGRRASGRAYCWGINAKGQLGDNTTTNRNTVGEVYGGYSDWRWIDISDRHTCGLRNGRAYCWGQGQYGRLADGNSADHNVLTPLQVGTYTDWQTITASSEHTCGIRGAGGEGDAYCWGYGWEGQVGGGSQTTNNPAPVLVSGGYTDWTWIHAKDESTCGLRSNGRAYCWGINDDGELGNGTTTRSTVPSEVSGGYTNWTSIITRKDGACGIRSGEVYCWGDNAFSQLGNGTATDSLIPVKVSGGWKDFKAIDLSQETGCALRGLGSVYCWGQGTSGEIGDGASANRNVPTLVSSISAKRTCNTASCASQTPFRAGANNLTCAINSEGKLYCWGDNNLGEIGNGTTNTTYFSPTLVSGGYEDWVSISTEVDMTCGLRATGDMYCWGQNTYGGIGDGTTTDRTVPTKVATYSDFMKMASDEYNACGIRANGTLYCWGLNNQGVVGDATWVDKHSPTLVSGGYTDWTDVTVSWTTCGLRGAGRAFCWGANVRGNVGNGVTGGNYNTPQEVSGSYTDWIKINNTDNTTCGIRSNSRAYCWGRGLEGQIGDGGTSDRNIPTEVYGAATGWTDIFSTYQTSCGINWGKVYCWGSNTWGAFGNYTSTASTTPVPLAGMISDFTRVSLDPGHGCAMRQNGELYCWGIGTLGALGQGSTTNYLYPVKVPLDMKPICTDCSISHPQGLKGSFLTAEGKAVSVGDNSTGLFGNGGIVDSMTPVETSLGGVDWTDFHNNNGRACGVKAGTLYCWGDRSKYTGDSGALAGTELNPKAVTGNYTDWVSVTAQWDSVCGLRKNGTAWCFGNNWSGIYGNGATGGSVNYPIQAASAYSDFVALATTDLSACGLRKGGTLYCWGYDNYGLVGNDAADSGFVTTPALVAGGYTDWNKVVSGAQGTMCAIRSGGRAYCWGENNYSETGTGSHAADVFTPTEVSGTNTDWQYIMGGDDGSCGIRGAVGKGRLYCWGYRPNNMIGDGGALVGYQDTPVEVAGSFTDWNYVYNAGKSTCATRTNGKFYCWGYSSENTKGDLGTNDTVQHTTPTEVLSIAASAPNGNGSCAARLCDYYYIADSNNQRIQKFDSNGNFVLKFGTNGTGDGQFLRPEGIDFDSSGNIYVADNSRSNVQKFDSNGNFILKFGTNGAGDGQFNNLQSISIDSNNYLYCADVNNHRIQKFDSNGNFIAKYGTNGAGDGQISIPTSMRADSSGNMWITEAGNDRVQELTNAFAYIQKFGSLGAGNGQMNDPQSVNFDASGNVWVADSANNRVQKFSSSGAYITKFGSTGTGNGQFQYPHGINIDSDGNIIVTEYTGDRVQKFDSNGNYLSQFGGSGSGNGQLDGPTFLVIRREVCQ